MSNAVTSPFPVFYDRAGQPLNAGYIYVGTAGINPEVSPITVYWDNALTITAAQPIRTLNGYPSRDGSASSMAISQSSYSIVVRDSDGTLVYSNLNYAPIQQTVFPETGFQITKPASGSTLAGNVIFDASANTIRIYENGGAGRGVKIDIGNASSLSTVTTNDGAQTLTDKTLTTPFINGANVSGTFSGKLLLNSTQTTIPAAGVVGNSLQVSNTDTSYGLLFGSRQSDGSGWIQAQRVDTTPAVYSLILNPNGGLVYVGPTGIQAPVAISAETSGAITNSSANKQVNCTGGITLSNSSFSAGDKITFDPGTSARTFTRGAGIAMYVNGVDSASATLSANRMGGVHWRSASVAILIGAFA